LPGKHVLAYLSVTVSDEEKKRFITLLPGRQSSAEVEAAFLVSDIPAVGFRSYYVQVAPAKR
jgi:hypothetical protein